MPKYVYLVQCLLHKDIKMYFVQKGQARIYYLHHLKTCLYVEEPLLVEAPYVG